MIRLEEDLKTVNKKIKFSDLEKEYIINNLSNLLDLASEPLPLIEEGAFWEVCTFTSYIYLPNSSGSPYPDIIYF